MPMSALERKRNSILRKREAARAMGDQTDRLAKEPFFAFLADDGNWSSVKDALDWAGMQAPSFDDDSDPEWHEDDSEPNRGSIGRAERMVGMMLDAATDLAGIINAYKRQAIEAKIAELEQSDFTNPEIREKALAEIVRLLELRRRLDKRIRRDLPEYQIKGG